MLGMYYVIMANDLLPSPDWSDLRSYEYIVLGHF